MDKVSIQYMGDLLICYEQKYYLSSQPLYKYFENSMNPFYNNTHYQHTTNNTITQNPYHQTPLPLNNYNLIESMYTTVQLQPYNNQQFLFKTFGNKADYISIFLTLPHQDKLKMFMLMEQKSIYGQVSDKEAYQKILRLIADKLQKYHAFHNGHRQPKVDNSADKKKKDLQSKIDFFCQTSFQKLNLKEAHQQYPKADALGHVQQQDEWIQSKQEVTTTVNYNSLQQLQLSNDEAFFNSKMVNQESNKENIAAFTANNNNNNSNNYIHNHHNNNPQHTISSPNSMVYSMFTFDPAMERAFTKQIGLQQASELEKLDIWELSLEESELKSIEPDLKQIFAKKQQLKHQLPQTTSDFAFSNLNGIGQFNLLARYNKPNASQNYSYPNNNQNNNTLDFNSLPNHTRHYTANSNHQPQHNQQLQPPIQSNNPYFGIDSQNEFNFTNIQLKNNALKQTTDKIQVNHGMTNHNEEDEEWQQAEHVEQQPPNQNNQTQNSNQDHIGNQYHQANQIISYPQPQQQQHPQQQQQHTNLFDFDFNISSTPITNNHQPNTQHPTSNTHNTQPFQFLLTTTPPNNNFDIQQSQTGMQSFSQHLDFSSSLPVESHNYQFDYSNHAQTNNYSHTASIQLNGNHNSIDPLFAHSSIDQSKYDILNKLKIELSAKNLIYLEKSLKTKSYQCDTQCYLIAIDYLREVSQEKTPDFQHFNQQLKIVKQIHELTLQYSAAVEEDQEQKVQKVIKQTKKLYNEIYKKSDYTEKMIQKLTNARSKEKGSLYKLGRMLIDSSISIQIIQKCSNQESHQNIFNSFCILYTLEKLNLFFKLKSMTQKIVQFLNQQHVKYKNLYDSPLFSQLQDNPTSSKYITYIKGLLKLASISEKMLHLSKVCCIKTNINVVKTMKICKDLKLKYNRFIDEESSKFALVYLTDFFKGIIDNNCSLYEIYTKFTQKMGSFELCHICLQSISGNGGKHDELSYHFSCFNILKRVQRVE